MEDFAAERGTNPGFRDWSLNYVEGLDSYNSFVLLRTPH